MLVWLLALLLLTLSIYILYRFALNNKKESNKHKKEHYTFKIEEG